jgi:hypothetical protein
MGNKVFSSRRPPPPLSNAAGTDRWTGVVHVPLSRGGPLFHVATSLILSPAKTLAVRLANHPGFAPLSPSLRLQCLNSDGRRFRAPTLSCSRATASAAPVIQRSSGSQTPPASPGYSLGSSPGTPTRGWSTRRASPGRLRCTGSLFRPWTPLATPRRMSPLASRLRLP